MQGAVRGLLGLPACFVPILGAGRDLSSASFSSRNWPYVSTAWLSISSEKL